MFQAIFPGNSVQDTRCVGIPYVSCRSSPHGWGVANVVITVFKRGKATPFLGSSHGSDIPEFYGSGPNADFQGTDALVNFANNLNPNRVPGKDHNSTLIPWPMWKTNPEAPPLLTFSDPNQLSITPDTFRVEGMQTLIKLSARFP